MKPARIIIALMALLLVFGGAGMAQGKGTLTVQANPSGAQVYIDGRLFGNATPNFTIALPARNYQVKVSKPGFQDFVTSVNLTMAGATIQANLFAIGQAAPPPPAPAPAPGPVTSGKPTLTVTSNPPSASVFVNGSMVGLTPYTGRYSPGTYKLSVRRSGYPNYEQTITLTADTQINANFGSPQVAPPPPPAQMGLYINANVQGAEVFLNGSPLGRTPLNAQVVPGSYNLTIRAPGYMDYNQSIFVNGQTQINAMLQGLQVGLSVNANVQGAEVYLNGSRAGNTPLNLNVIPGSYNVTVKAPGYGDYNQSVVVNGPTQVNAVLQGVMSSWQVNVPDNMVNKDLKGGHWSQIMVYLDGNLQRGPAGQIGPGRHVVRVTSGGMAVELVFDAQPGRTYSFEPFMGINVK